MPPKLQPTDSVGVSLRLPRELVEKIEARADDEVRNRTQMIRVLLLQALATNEKTA